MKTQMDEAWQKGISTFPSFLAFLFFKWPPPGPLSVASSAAPTLQFGPFIKGFRAQYDVHSSQRA